MNKQSKKELLIFFLIASVIGGKDTPLFVYCYSGARSRQAAGALRRMGYSNVKNIGGIAAWKGKVEC